MDTTADEGHRGPAPDLTAFLVFHNGLRRDFGRLADVIDRTAPDDHDRLRLVDEHLGMLLRALHHHHVSEDEDIWPMVRAAVPESGPVLAELEADHATLDEAIADIPGAADRATQAAGLRRLQDLLGAHLDREESDVVPLIIAQVDAADWDRSAKAVVRAWGRDLPSIASWLLDSADERERERILDAAPLALRVLYFLRWRRTYGRRTAQIYG